MRASGWLIFVAVCIGFFLWTVFRVTTIIAVLLSVFLDVDAKSAVAWGFFLWLGYVAYISVSAAVKK